MPVLQLLIICYCQPYTQPSSSSTLSSSSPSPSSSLLLHLFPRPQNKSLKQRHSSSPILLSSLHRSSVNSNPRPSTLPNATYSCAVHLPKGCSCFKRDGSLSLNCSGTRLHSIPRALAEVGSTIVKNLSLERNQIRGINDGDFFGLKIERLLLGHNYIEKLDFLAFWGLEYSLETLDLSYNRFIEVPTEALRLLRNLRSLSLTGNRIAATKDYDFGYLRNLGVLGLDKNPIACVSTQAFTGTQLYLLNLAEVRLSPSGLESLPAADLKHLKGLSLAGNRILKIPAGGWFRNMKILRYLSLDENSLKDIPDEDAFLGLEETLRTLELSGNRLHSVPVKALQRLRNLEALDLSRNRIRRLHKRQLNASQSLLSLNLSDNRISKISRRAFHGLMSIQQIDLRNNRLVTLDEFAVSSLTPADGSTTIFLSGNPWLCNCMVKWLRREAKKQSSVTEAANSIGDWKSMKCDRPAELEAMPLVSVPLKDFTCDHDYYYYYYDDDYDDKGSNNDGDDDDNNSTHNESSSKKTS